jgi:hypothetical protein
LTWHNEVAEKNSSLYLQIVRIPPFKKLYENWEAPNFLLKKLATFLAYGSHSEVAWNEGKAPKISRKWPKLQNIQ